MVNTSKDEELHLEEGVKRTPEEVLEDLLFNVYKYAYGRGWDDKSLNLEYSKHTMWKDRLANIIEKGKKELHGKISNKNNS